VQQGMDSSGMQQWQSGVWVKSCEKVKYPHYCNTTALDKEHCEFFEKSVIKQKSVMKQKSVIKQMDKTRTILNNIYF
jgi:hypothetical protein